MANFNYTAIAADGKEKKGTIEAANVDAAKNSLKSSGLIPVSVEIPNAFSKDLSIGGGKVPAKDLSVFCKQFESILHAGVTVLQALDMMTDQADNKNLKAACRNTKLLVEKGETLASAMADFPNVFPPMLINMVEAGEASGSLETSFNRMATHFEKDARLKSLVVQAMIYPIILLIVVIAVVIVMLVKIVPTFKETFEGAGASLPALTIAVVNISNGMVHSWYIVVGVIVGIVVAGKLWARTESGAVILGNLMLRMPLFGNLTIKQSSARFARTLSTLTASGIPLVNAIEICSKIMTNKIVSSVITNAKKDVEAGIPLSQPLEQSGVFPPLLYQMTHIGEETGNMEEMLEHCADFYDEEVEAATQAITTIMEPMIIVIMAAIVCPIIGAVMLPMLNIYSVAENS